MDAKAHDLNFVLGQKQHWVVPVYQRHYEWETAQDKQLPKLWEDLRDKAIERLDERIPLPHYFGAIIYAEPAKQAFGATPRRFLVDGQQRITTFELVVAALREVAREKGIERLVQVADTYLFNERSAGMEDPNRERFKLWPSSYDRDLFKRIIECTPDGLRAAFTPEYFYKNGSLKTGQAPKLLRAYWYLFEEIRKFLSERVEEDETAEITLDALVAGFLSGFQIVVIQLDQGDDAQEIFASLNGMAKPLSPFDLIRNDVFHRARKTGEDDEKLFDERWREFENPFWSQEVRQGRFKRARADHLVAHAVVAETAREVNVGKIATEYQYYARERAFGSIAEELDILLAHARTYRALETPDPATDIGKIALVLRAWDLSTFHPLVLWISAYVDDEEERRKLFELVETYIVRREICGLTTKNYNKVASGFIRAMQNAASRVEAFLSHLDSLTGEISRMPSDAQLAEAIAQNPIYAVTPQPRIRYILQQLEYALRDKFDEVTVATANLTIEHVMPKKWSTHWPLPNGQSVKQESSLGALMAGEILDDATKALVDARVRVIDTLGNLTLVTGAMNPSLGNSDWPTKKERIANSLLAINRKIAGANTWDERSIGERASELAAIAANRWRFSQSLIQKFTRHDNTLRGAGPSA